MRRYCRSRRQYAWRRHLPILGSLVRKHVLEIAAVFVGHFDLANEECGHVPPPLLLLAISH